MQGYKKSDHFVTKVNTKTPIKIMFYVLCFIYILQFPLSLMLNVNPETNIQVTTYQIFEAYIFVLLSISVLFFFFYLGTRNSSKKVSLYFSKKNELKRISFIKCLFIFFFFFLWSYVMLKLKIGLTFYADFDLR